MLGPASRHSLPVAFRMMSTGRQSSHSYSHGQTKEGAEKVSRVADALGLYLVGSVGLGGLWGIYEGVNSACDEIDDDAKWAKKSGSKCQPSASTIRFKKLLWGSLYGTVTGIFGAITGPLAPIIVIARQAKRLD